MIEPLSLKRYLMNLNINVKCDNITRKINDELIEISFKKTLEDKEINISVPIEENIPEEYFDSIKNNFLSSGWKNFDYYLTNEYNYTELRIKLCF